MSNESSKQKQIRVADEFAGDLVELKGKTEIKVKRDVSLREMTKAMSQDIDWQIYKKNFVAKIKDFKNDNLGAIGWDYIILGITTIFMMVFFIFFSYGVNVAYTQMMTIHNPSIPSSNGGNASVINVTGAFQNTLGKVDSSYLELRWLGIILVFASCLGIVVSNMMVRDYPVAFLAYSCFIIFSVFIATYISNAYELAVNSPFIKDYASGWIGYNWIMFNLPTILTVIGFIGAILLVSNVIIPRPE